MKCQNSTCDNIVGHEKRNGTRYCCNRCSEKDYYLKNKEKIILNSSTWAKLNPDRAKHQRKKALEKFREEKPERFNELMRSNYYRNKQKQIARVTTRYLLQLNKNRGTPLLSEMCNKCGTKNGLEVHHEVYQTKIKEIIASIKDGKIYYKCLKCHGRRNTHRFK